MNIKYIVIVECSTPDSMMFSNIADANTFIYEYIRDFDQNIDRIITCTIDADQIQQKQSFVRVIDTIYPRKMSKKEFSQLKLF